MTTHEIEYIDAERAALYLSTNTHNRPMSRTVVTRYATDMKAGRWEFTADPIRFAAGGRLIDGQHRLAAIVEAGEELPAPLQFLIVRELSSDSQQFMDQGRKRTTGDQMTLLGYREANRVAAGARLYLMWDRNLLFRNTDDLATLTPSSVIEWADKNIELIDFCRDIVPRDRNIILGEPRVAMAFAMIACQVDEQRAKAFFESLASLANLPEGSPILVLHKRLLNIRNDRTRVSPRDQLAMFCQTWNYWVTGRSIAQLGRPAGGFWKEANFPVLLDPADVKAAVRPAAQETGSDE